MSGVTHSRAFTDRLVERLKATAPGARPAPGDFAAICTNFAADIWVLYPIMAALSDGTVLTVESSIGGRLAVTCLDERDQVIVTAAAEFIDIPAVRELCWTPIQGLGGLRVTMTKSQKDALEWLAKRGGDGCFDLNGVVLAAGEYAPHTRSTWNALRDLGLVEFYNPAGKGRGRLRVAA
jgi:hypothetical protein